jgi:hypothetical protein
MKNENQLHHDLTNMIERLRIMHDLVKKKNFEDITKEELKSDLSETLNQIKNTFDHLLQY